MRVKLKTKKPKSEMEALCAPLKPRWKKKARGADTSHRS